MSARVSFLWGDGEHTFRLPLGLLRELQDKTGVGPHALLRRIAARDWRVDDLRETIRLGLIGGGMEPVEAVVAVSRYVDVRPLLESVVPAMAILTAALTGEDVSPGEDVAPESTVSTSAPSTDQEP